MKAMIVIVLVALVFLTACGGGSSKSTSSATSTPAQAVQAATRVPASTSTPAPTTAPTVVPTSTPVQLAKCTLVPAGTASDVLQVTSPAAGIPANLAGYSGVWEGKWGNAAEGASLLVVKSVTATQTSVVYFPPPANAGKTQPVNNINFTPDGKIAAGTIVFALSADGKSIAGTLSQNGQVTAQVAMTRCAP